MKIIEKCRDSYADEHENGKEPEKIWMNPDILMTEPHFYPHILVSIDPMDRFKFLSIEYLHDDA